MYLFILIIFHPVFKFSIADLCQNNYSPILEHFQWWLSPYLLQSSASLKSFNRNFACILTQNISSSLTHPSSWIQGHRSDLISLLRFRQTEILQSFFHVTILKILEESYCVSVCLTFLKLLVPRSYIVSCPVTILVPCM